MTRILITGANRGIGLALTALAAERPDAQLFAACRQPEKADDLQALADAHPGRVTILPLDVTDQPSITAAADAIAGRAQGLDVLINNAGINPRGGLQALDAITAELMLHILHVNTVGPLMVAQAFAPLLRAGQQARLVNVSSQLGSLARGTSGGQYGYRASKAALNMITRSLAGDLGPGGVTVVTMHPGWVQTDMGGPAASLTPDESARAMWATIDRLTPADNGRFLRWDGTEHPW